MRVPRLELRSRSALRRSSCSLVRRLVLDMVKRLLESVENKPVRQSFIDIRYIPAEDRPVLLDQVPNIFVKLCAIRVHFQLFNLGQSDSPLHWVVGGARQFDPVAGSAVH